MTFLLVLWTLGSLSIGLPLALRALANEYRASVLLAAAMTGGYALQSIVLILLWGIVPLGTAYYVTVSASPVLGAIIALRLYHTRDVRRFRWGINARETLLTVMMLGGFAFLAHRLFTVGYSSWDAEALYWHAGNVGWMSRGTFPPTAVLEPDYPLHYRFGIYALPAAIVANTGAPPPEVMTAALAQFVPLMVLAFVGASMRFSNGPRTGLLAAFLALFGGSLLPIATLLTHGLDVDGSGHVAYEFVTGLIWLGNNLDMLHNNVTITSGFVAFSCALWLTWETIAAEKKSACGILLAVASLAFLALANEVHFVSLLGGMSLSIAGGAIRERSNQLRAFKQRVLPFLAIGATATAILFIRGGILGGAALANLGEGSVKLMLNTTHFGEVPTAPGIWSPSFLPFLSNDVQLDTNLAFVGIPILLAYAWRRRDGFVLAGLTSAVLPLIAWLTIYPAVAPWDGFRFAQAGLLIYLSMLPFVASAARARYAVLRSPTANVLSGLLLVALTSIHVVMATWLSATWVPPSVAVPGSPDYAAAELLRASSHTSRVLVPLSVGDSEDHLGVYRTDDLGAALRTIAGVSAHAIPMGHNGYDNADKYGAIYRKAGTTFDDADLALLAIDWVYVLPQYLTPEQKRNMSLAIERGALHLIRSWGDSGTSSERLLFRFQGD